MNTDVSEYGEQDRILMAEEGVYIVNREGGKGEGRGEKMTP